VKREDAPVLEQPDYFAMHIRRRSSKIVSQAAKALRELVATGKYGS
jgi:hypothetical protein